MILNKTQVLCSIIASIGCIVLSSCATPPGEVIGNTVCECLRKTGGDRSKIQVCMARFKEDVKAEVARQNLPEGTNNEEAARAMSIMRLCMRSVSGWDTLRPMPPMTPTSPPFQPSAPTADSLK